MNRILKQLSESDTKEYELYLKKFDDLGKQLEFISVLETETEEEESEKLEYLLIITLKREETSKYILDTYYELVN